MGGKVSLANKGGLQDGLSPLGNDVTLHIACHARAQNMGRKAAELLKLIPETPVHVIERCSGHGGVWGTMAEHFDTALKVGKPVAENALRQEAYYLVSECPLAATHIGQGVSFLSPDAQTTLHIHHPIELLALSYEKGVQTYLNYYRLKPVGWITLAKRIKRFKALHRKISNVTDPS